MSMKYSNVNKDKTKSFLGMQTPERSAIGSQKFGYTPSNMS